MFPEAPNKVDEFCITYVTIFVGIIIFTDV